MSVVFFIFTILHEDPASAKSCSPKTAIRGKFGNLEDVITQTHTTLAASSLDKEDSSFKL